MSDQRSEPARPILAVSAAIMRDGKVLIVRRAKPPALGLYTLPGGRVELGETVNEAARREIREETALTVEPLGLAGTLEAIQRDKDGGIEAHFVILCFAARWVSGELKLNAELDDARWLTLDRLAGLQTTDGLAEIVANAFAIAGR